MTKYIALAILAICCLTSKAQDGQISHYVFPDFVNGTIKFKDGTTIAALLNYNTLSEEMIFKQSGGFLAVSETAKIDTVTIDDRYFIPETDFFYEVVNVKNKVLYVKHKASIILPAANAGIGGTSQTAGQTSTVSIRTMNGIYNLKMPDSYRVIPGTSFFMRTAKGYQRINSANSLATVYPGKLEIIKASIKANKLNLAKLPDLVTLLNSL